ncbi:hypothetical protein EVJ58_g3149 [Rhodofomes roseus]|uniref:Uncharacterized protein n=1 Tax=Rhodofomes roseus TaxID=34475 RepID=A0A4Y9YPL6_9APHY|nr:hypothetical protein EVJ58_g3149 [Rhodofomes roseus]
MSNASAPLPADLHHALEQAIGNANNAVDISRKKKSKRVRDDDNVADVSGAETPLKKKKKGRGHEHQDASPGEEQVTVAQADPALSAAEAGDADVSEESGKKKKKKSKKGKEKETSEVSSRDVSESQPEAASSADIAASSADFLNAVVAAASATSGQTAPPGQPYDPSMASPSHCLPYPPQQPDYGIYQYGPPPGHPAPFAPHAHGQAAPSMFPDPNGMLPDLQFTSSEDLLRTLQEFDLSKVMHVLRSLGDAANAANVSVTMPPHMAPPQMPPPVVNKPVRSEAILGRPPKQRRPPQPQEQGPARSLASIASAVAHVPSHAPMVAPVAAPMPPPPPPAPPSQEGNVEHAHMLANVWMNAQKLADMVKQEGKSFWYRQPYHSG